MIVGGFLASVSTYWVGYHVTILFAALLVAEVLFLPETLYPRAHLVAAEGENTGLGAAEKAADVRRTKQLPWMVSCFRKFRIRC